MDGYCTALELLPKIARLGFDARSRHHWLLGEKSENLGPVAATCAIQLGHLKEAVELLNLGQSVFWQRASLLRSDLETLREADPDLAKVLERIGLQLDAGNFSASDFSIGEYLVEDDQHSAKATAEERRQLIGLWEGLVERIRQLLQFEDFMRPIPFHQLRQVSTTGRVIIINASHYGVDALVFGASGPIEHVPLPNIVLETLAELASNIVLQRPVNPSEAQRWSYVNCFLKPALRRVWNNILVPIFNKIHIRLAETAARRATSTSNLVVSYWPTYIYPNPCRRTWEWCH